MIREGSFYYRLYGYRTSTPREIFSAIHCQLITKAALVRGFADILDGLIPESPDTLSSAEVIQKGLARVGEALHSIFKEFAFQEPSDCTHSMSPGEQLASFRNQVLPHATALRSIAASMRETASTFELTLPDADYWVERIEDASREIWVTIDVLTNPDLRLPSHLMDWLRIREVVHNQACSGDQQALEPLLEALQNPEPDIRQEAAMLLRHLKNQRSVAPLIVLLNDEYESVRTEAAVTLGIVGDQQAVEPLVACLIKYKDSRWGPARALGDLCAPCALQALVVALDEELAKEQPIPRTLANLVRALESIGGPEAEQALTRYREANSIPPMMGSIY